MKLPEKLKSEDLAKAAGILKSGGIVIFPTDTVYGIGCRWDYPISVAKIYKIKNTPSTQAFPILVSSTKQVKEISQVTPIAQTLMEKYWPGALTIILSPRHPELVSGSKKIGFRLPDSAIIQALIEQVGVPVIGTSANIHGKSAVRTSSELDRQLTKQVDYVLEGECEGGVESTVVDATEDPPKVLRQGAVKLQG